MTRQSVDLPEEGLLQARRFLRDLQAQHPTRSGVVQAALDSSTLDAALASLSQRRIFQPTDDPGVGKRDGLKFDRELENGRIALAEDLIRRVYPGPFEDPVYLALLAYQAASIEMALPGSADGNRTDPGWSRFLLGTIHSPELNAFSQRFDSHGYVVVAMYSALVEFMYQAAKAVIAAQNPGRSADHRFSVTADSSAGHIAEQLDLNEEPIERLYRTMEAWFFNGYPRAFQNESVPAEHVMPLTLLIGMSERWVIAHEFGHGFAAKIDWANAPVESPDRAEEYFADDNATVLTAMSAAKLDRVPPEYALIGGTFALACLEIFQRGLSIVRDGREAKDAADAEHPASRLRAEHSLRAFQTFFGAQVRSEPASVRSGSALDRNHGSVVAETTQSRGQWPLEYPNALLSIWGRVRPRLLRDFEEKRLLNPIWR